MALSENLRRILEGVPSRAAFVRLCRTLRAEGVEAVAEVGAALEQWPDAVRTMTWPEVAHFLEHRRWRAEGQLATRFWTQPWDKMDAAKLEQMLGIAELPRLTTLDLRGHKIGVKGAKVLAASAHLGSLRTLNLSGCEIGIGGARALAASPHLTGLRRLNLNINKIGLKGALALAHSSTLAVDRLEVPSNAIPAQGITTIVSSPNAARLHTLALDHNELGPAVAAALARTPHLGGLRSLSTACSYDKGFRAADVSTLTQGSWLEHIEHLSIQLIREDEEADVALMALLARSMPKLRTLNLHTCCISDRGALALAQSPNLPGLHSLIVHASMLTSEGLAALLTSPRRAALRRLDLDNPHGLTEGDFTALLDRLLPTPLQRLSLRGARLGNASVEALTHSRAFPDLLVLDLQGIGRGHGPLAHLLPQDDEPELDEAGLLSLARSDNLPQLELLGLAHTPRATSVRVLEALLSEPRIRTLRRLDVRNCELSAAELESLVDHPGLGRMTCIAIDVLRGVTLPQPFHSTISWS